MQRNLLATLLISAMVLLIAALAFAQVDEARKTEVNKIIEMIGFTPKPELFASANETEPNDDCSMPDPADILVDVVAGAIDAAGDEDWYTFDGLTGDCVTIATDASNGSTTDTQLYLYDAANCSDTSAYLVWNDDSGPGLFSLIADFALPATGTYYVRVKHYSASGTGAYELSASSAACPTPPANDLCADAEPIQCGASVSGTTDLAGNDLEDLAENCVPYGADGPDVFYSIEVPSSYQLTATLTPTNWDPALWFVTDCNDELSCVAGVDTGFYNDVEVLSWVNDTAGSVLVYVIPDGYYSGAHGPFDLTVMCDQVVAAQESTWGAVKTRF